MYRQDDDGDVVYVCLSPPQWDLPNDYLLATGMNFWEKVKSAVLGTFPGCKLCGWPSYDHGVISFEMGTALRMTKSYQGMIHKCSLDLCERVKETLEQHARLQWLRPGVPPLLKLTKNFVTSNKRNLIISVIEFQRKHGYDSTKLFLEQFEDDMLYGGFC